MSPLRNDDSKRRRAKCTHCLRVFPHGKPELLYRHIKDECSGIPPSERSSYLQMQISSPDGQPATSTDPPPTSARRADKGTGRPAVPRKRKAPPSAETTATCRDYFTSVQPERGREMHALLLKAFITSDVPLSFLENPYFQRYQHELVRCPYDLPHEASIITQTLPAIYNNLETDILLRVRPLKAFTLALDGWTDLAGNTVFVLSVLRGPRIQCLIDILDLHQPRLCAENIASALEKSLKKKDIDIGNACGLVTDSPTVMIKFQSILTSEHPQILKIQCILHALNSIMKDLISYPTIGDLINNNLVLVNYLTASDFWAEHLETWQKDHDITPGTRIFCGSRWTSIGAICLGVQVNEGGFQHCYQLSIDPTVDTPSLPEDVLRVIEDQHHFRTNEALAILLKPLIDASGRLEHYDLNLSDVWKELITVYRALQETLLPVQFQGLKDHCIEVVRRRSTLFEEDIYIIAFFLHPTYRRVLRHTLEDLTRMILQIAKSWKFTRGEAISIREQLGRYYSYLHPFNFQMPASRAKPKALQYWLSIPDSPQFSALRRLAIAILEIVPRATGAENLVDSASLPKSKTGGRMPCKALRQTYQLKHHLLQEKSHDKSNSSTIDPELHGATGDPASFLLPTFMGTFPEGTLPADLVITKQDAFLDTSFDFDTWLELNTTSAHNTQVIDIDENWEPEEIFARFC